MNQRDEVEKVISEIAKEKQKGRAYRDMTILYRTNAQSRVFEEAFCDIEFPIKFLEECNSIKELKSKIF